ncbi:MAG: hypothetical protein ACTTKO_07675 [Candidatus Limimorpha sp.]
MKRITTLLATLLIVFCFTNNVAAQLLPDVPSMKGRWVAGGNFSAGLYGSQLNVGISPQIGYRVFDRLEVGTRLIYELDYLFDRQNGNLAFHYFGGAASTSLRVYKGLFLHAEDELLYGMSVYNHTVSNGNWFNSIFAGGGYRQYFSNRGYAYFLVLYNLSYDLHGSLETPYFQPIVFRVGYCFGF